MKIPPFNPRRPRWDTIQQVVRYFVVIVATSMYGEDWVDDPLISRAVPVVAGAVALLWWAVWVVNRPSVDDPVSVVAREPAAPAPAPEPEEGTTTVTTTTTKEPPDESGKPKEKPK